MSGLSPLLLALAATALALMFNGWWFGVLRRRRAETEAGVRALAGMKWRECAGLVLQSLAEKGYSEAPASRQPGDGGTEFVLVKGGERTLLGYKHGTAYRLGEANVRDFANAVQLQAATTGILVTLGSAESFARDLARRYGVELIDGGSLWPRVEPYAPTTMLESIRAEAAERIRRGRRIGFGASLVLGLVVFLVAYLGSDAPAPPAPSPAPVAAAPAAPEPAPAPAADEAMPESAGPAATEPAPATDTASQQVEQARRALEELASLDDQKRAERRLAAASAVARLDRVSGASWSTNSTLSISLTSTDETEAELTRQACAVLAGYEELRYSRLQLEPPSGSDARVRWRTCQ